MGIVKEAPAARSDTRLVDAASQGRHAASLELEDRERPQGLHYPPPLPQLAHVRSGAERGRGGTAWKHRKCYCFNLKIGLTTPSLVLCALSLLCILSPQPLYQTLSGVVFHGHYKVYNSGTSLRMLCPAAPIARAQPQAYASCMGVERPVGPLCFCPILPRDTPPNKSLPGGVTGAWCVCAYSSSP